MKVLGIGEAVIDKIRVVKRPGHGWADGTILSSDQDAGGPVVVALMLLAKAGYDSTLITSVGNDAEGQQLKQVLKTGGVALCQHSQPSTQINTILVDASTGQRQKVRGDTKRDPIQNLDPAFIQSFDLIIVDRHERQAFYEIAKHKKEHTILITDPSTEVSDFTFSMMRHADMPIVPVETLLQLSEGRSLLASAHLLYNICNKSFVVTMGQYGSLFFDGTKHRISPPLHIHAVNTLGAGDVYRGAFALGLLQAWDTERCARFANDAAAVQCTKMGNAAVVPSLTEIEANTKKYSHLTVTIGDLEKFFTELYAESVETYDEVPLADVPPFYEQILPA